MNSLLDLISESYQRNVGRPFAQLAGNGVRGLLGLDPADYADSLGMEAYRNAQALSNAPTPLAFAALPAAVVKGAKAAKAVKAAPRDEALETARKNAVTMLGLPENNTAMDRARALGYTDDTFHGTFNRFDNFDMSKANPRSQYMPGIFTADNAVKAENYGDYIMPLLQRKGTTVLDKAAARQAGLPLPAVDTIHDKAAGVRVTTNPTNIRSRFAAFDPARVNENDLLGAADPALLAILAAGTGGYALSNRRRKEEPVVQMSSLLAP